MIANTRALLRTNFLPLCSVTIYNEEKGKIMPEERKKRFRVVKIFGIALILLIAAIIALPFIIDANQFRPVLESKLTSALGRDVKVGNLRLSILSGSVAADDISIADDQHFSRSPFVTAKSLLVGVELRPLILSRAVHITGITLDRPEITLIRSASGEWNFSRIGQTTSVKDPPVEKSRESSAVEISIAVLKITDGRLTVVGGNARDLRHVYDKVNVTARDLSYMTAFPFTLSANLPGGGSVKIEGKAGPINQADTLQTPFSANLNLSGLDLLASGFVLPESGLAGRIDFVATASSDGKQIESRGQAKAERVQIVKTGSPAGRPVSLQYTLSHNLKNQAGKLGDTRIDIGKAVAHLEGTYETRGDSTFLKSKLRGETMPVEDLEAMLPAVGITLPKGASLQSGTLSINVASEGPIEKLVSTGTVEMSKARLAGFDLGGKLATVAKLSGIRSSQGTDIEKLSSDLRLAPEGIHINSLLLIVPALGELTGTGTIGTNQSLDCKMLAKITTSGGVAGSVARLAGIGAGNEISVPFFIRGTTSDPSFIPDIQGTAGSLIQSVTGKRGQSEQDLGNALKNLFGKKKKP